MKLFNYASVFVALTLLSACADDPAPDRAPQAPPPSVGVYTIAAQSLTLTTELPGRTAAYRVAEVRPQVNGIIQKRLFTEGADVREGEPLYQIDDAKYQAAYHRAKATLTNAERLAKRYEGLLADKAISRQQYDDAHAAWELAKAELELSRIDLVYTKVLSPIDGRIGRSAVTEGALVTANQAQALATVQQIDPIYVDMTQPVSEVLRLRQDLASGRIERADEHHARVLLRLESGQIYPLEGTLELTEVSVDPDTGSVALRAVFPNPDGYLLPGMFVHARLSEGRRENAILVPQQGVTRDAKGQATAWVIGADNQIELRRLETERTVGNQWLVSDGLEPGDRVITEGLQRLRPGMRVEPVEATNVSPVFDFGDSATAAQ